MCGRAGPEARQFGQSADEAFWVAGRRDGLVEPFTGQVQDRREDQPAQPQDSHTGGYRAAQQGNPAHFGYADPWHGKRSRLMSARGLG